MKQNGRVKFSPGAPVDRSKVVEARPVIKHHAAALDDITLTHCQRLRHANISGAVVLRVDVRSRVRALNSIGVLGKNVKLYSERQRGQRLVSSCNG